MRLIDADKLIENIENTADLGGWIGDTLRQIKRLAVRYINSAPSIDIDRPQEWIPCSERLPEIEREGQRRGWYLTTNGYGDVCETQYEFYHDFLKTGWQSDIRIVAWMPLPEPYREERTEE